MVEKKHVEGMKKGEILLYVLSTCIWCKKTKSLLNELGVEYDFIEVDLIEDLDEKKGVQKEIKKWNPELSFPTIVINEKDCIRGFEEDKIREICK